MTNNTITVDLRAWEYLRRVAKGADALIDQDSETRELAADLAVIRAEMPDLFEPNNIIEFPVAYPELFPFPAA